MRIEKERAFETQGGILWKNNSEGKVRASFTSRNFPSIPGLKLHKSVYDLGLEYQEGKPGTINKSLSEAKPGIYLLYCYADNRAYIGKSVNVKNRLYSHQSALNSGKHVNVHLQNAYNKYGAENFMAMMIETVEDLNELSEREYFWAEKYDAHKKGFNIAPILKGEAAKDEYRLKLSGENSGNALLRNEQVAEICSLLNKGTLSYGKIGILYGISRYSIYLIKHGKRWKSITEHYLSPEITSTWKN